MSSQIFKPCLRAHLTGPICIRQNSAITIIMNLMVAIVSTMDKT